MGSETPLDQIWESYQVMCDCLKIAQRGVSRKDMHLLNRTNFWTSPEEQAIQQIKKGRSDANDYVILSLWAAFEKIIKGLHQMFRQRKHMKYSQKFLTN